jgi:hypothetical protein
MTLDEFIETMKEKLDDFEVFWNDEQINNTEDYPSEMDFTDWLEQFEITSLEV